MDQGPDDLLRRVHHADRLGRFGHERKHRNHLPLIERMMRDELPARLADAAVDAAGVRSDPRLPHRSATSWPTSTSPTSTTARSPTSREMEFVVPGPGRDRRHPQVLHRHRRAERRRRHPAVAERQEHEFERLGLDFRSLWGRPLAAHRLPEPVLRDRQVRPRRPPRGQRGVGADADQAEVPAAPDPIGYWYPPKWGINESVGLTQAERVTPLPPTLREG